MNIISYVEMFTNPKDSYDVFALTHYLGGPRQAAEYFNKAYVEKKITPANRKLLEHSLSVIRDKFKNAKQMGPFQVASFTDGEYETEIVAASINAFLNSLDFKS